MIVLHGTLAMHRLNHKEEILLKVYNAENIRNIALAGHGGRGKTTLAEAMLFLAKATERLGKIADGTSVLDYDAAVSSEGFSCGLGIIGDFPEALSSDRAIEKVKEAFGLPYTSLSELI